MNLRGLVLSMVGPALLAGCNDLPEDGTADDDAQAQHALHSWVVVERVEADGGVRTNVSAKFVHVADADVDIAQRLVGSRPEIPPSGDCVPIASLEGSTGVALAGSSFSVDLVDVGNVTLAMHEPIAPEAGTDEPTRVALSPRAFPDIGDLVSGVFYTSPDAALGLPVPGNYEIGGTGSMSMDAFVIDVRAPDAPRNVIVAGAEAGEDPVGVRRGDDIELDWAPPTAPGDLVYVDIRGASSAHRCTFPDGGAAVLPAGVLGAGDDTATITLHRMAERIASVRVVSASDTRIVEDPHDAKIVFDFARSISVRVR